MTFYYCYYRQNSNFAGRPCGLGQPPLVSVSSTFVDHPCAVNVDPTIKDLLSLRVSDTLADNKTVSPITFYSNFGIEGV